MTDMELAEEIALKTASGDNARLTLKQWNQIIAALRRGPLEEWSQQVRLTVRGIDAQAERITKREQTTWRDGENQAPDEDRDFEDVVIGYKLNTGLWHRLLGLLASCPANERPPSGEMMMVPREPTEAMIRAAFDTGQFENGVFQVPDIAASCIYRAMLQAAEASKEAK